MLAMIMLAPQGAKTWQGLVAHHHVGSSRSENMAGTCWHLKGPEHGRVLLAIIMSAAQGARTLQGHVGHHHARM
jgi:hypothetical protein